MLLAPLDCRLVPVFHPLYELFYGAVRGHDLGISLGGGRVVGRAVLVASRVACDGVSSDAAGPLGRIVTSAFVRTVVQFGRGGGHRRGVWGRLRGGLQSARRGYVKIDLNGAQVVDQHILIHETVHRKVQSRRTGKPGTAYMVLAERQGTRQTMNHAEHHAYEQEVKGRSDTTE